jgi:uncharacterized protein YdaT
MPWKSSDAKRHTKKATTPARARQWRDIANAALARGLTEGEAIREANGVIKNPKRRTRKTR